MMDKGVIFVSRDDNGKRPTMKNLVRMARDTARNVVEGGEIIVVADTPDMNNIAKRLVKKLEQLGASKAQ